MLLLFLLAACGDRPRRRLPLNEEVLVPVLRDVHLAEASMQNQFGPAKDSLAEVYYNLIFSLHDVDRADFEETMAILRQDPERMQAIYSKVLEELTEEELQAQ